MCGITGIFDGKNDSIDAALLNRMNDSLRHRGPNDSGYHLGKHIGLAHRRLSIIDLSTGKQPIYNEDQSVVVVFNGEIYNFLELRVELNKLGHRFETSTDTEVIVHAWEQWGSSCVDRFRGMFAFAIWDAKSQLLFLARDRLGIKPLYYGFLAEKVFVFASELKAIRAHPAFRAKIDPRAVEDYFAYGYIPDPLTIYQDIKKLPPGHTLSLSKEQQTASVACYWDVPFDDTAPRLSEEDAIPELIERLKDAVKVRLVSDVPLGAFLSGGVDSSAVVALMSELQPERTSTCSISFGNKNFDEAKYAEEVASRYQTNHFVKEVDVDDYDLVGKLANIYDEPFADSSSLPTYRLCELARQKVTVALSGDGGDENFAGYRDHRFHYNKSRIRRFFPDPCNRILFGSLAAIYPRLAQAPRFLRARTTFQTLAVDPIQSFARSRMITTLEERRALFSDRFRRELQGYQSEEVMRRHAANAPSEHPLSVAQYLDMKVYLPADILTKVDRASMAHSLEVRVPILDHEFVEWVATLAPNLKLRRGIGKYIFKKALESKLSPRILHRPKMGFSVPVSDWFRGPLKARLHECLFNSRLSQIDIFNPKSLERFYSEHINGHRDHGQLLWSLVMFDSFLALHSEWQ